MGLLSNNVTNPRSNQTAYVETSQRSLFKRFFFSSE